MSLRVVDVPSYEHCELASSKMEDYSPIQLNALEQNDPLEASLYFQVQKLLSKKVEKNDRSFKEALYYSWDEDIRNYWEEIHRQQEESWEDKATEVIQAWSDLQEMDNFLVSCCYCFS